MVFVMCCILFYLNVTDGSRIDLMDNRGIMFNFFEIYTVYDGVKYE